MRGSRRGSASSLPPGPPPPSLPPPRALQPRARLRPADPGLSRARGAGGGLQQGARSPAERCGTGTGRPLPPPPRPARPGLRWMPAAGQVPAWCGRRSSAPGQPGATAKDAWLTFPLLAFPLRLVARGRRKGGHGPWPPPSLVPSSCTRSLEPLGAKPDRMCALNAAPSRGRERDGERKEAPGFLNFLEGALSRMTLGTGWALTRPVPVDLFVLLVMFKSFQSGIWNSVNRSAARRKIRSF